ARSALSFSRMRVFVINTGTELLLGDVINTHLAFIARAIFPLGLRVDRQVAIPDGASIHQSLAEAFGASDILFVTGGLGPTTDDVTREATAELLARPLRRDAAIAGVITAHLERNRFAMTDRILRQADVPEGAVVLPNENGTAPGLYLQAADQRGRKTPHLFLLPGPPRELHPMFTESVVPILRGIVPSEHATESRIFSIACVGESVVEAAVGEELLAMPELELGYCAHAGAVDVRILGSAESVNQAERIITEAFGKAIYTSAGETLEAVVIRLLSERNQTVATAESCTGGYLAHRLTNVAGASAAFLAAEITYANDAKTRELGVSEQCIQENGAVSEIVARAMAESVRLKTGASYALATTGLAGPGGGSDAKPVGTVFVALASPSDPTKVQQFRFLSDRQTFKHLTTQRALEMLRQQLIAS
ncbi:MAG: CinA family nicotinamide mononucleotide deamidase-related protein, partial [Chthoniobacterales bacterium]|nr:CinA family nicotinamide mononucleotide deamidase-related protein [Chthoniobacterales bacterium]